MMNEIWIENALLHGQAVDLQIVGNRIGKILPHGSFSSVGNEEAMRHITRIDATGMTVFPPFYNTHNHAAMTLLRGYADDLPLMEWLEKHIWPAEATFTADHIRAGVRLACLEMIKTGTVFFNDMYWMEEIALPVVEEMGLRGVLGVSFIEARGKEAIQKDFELLESFRPTGNVTLSVAPHAIYTVGADLLREAAALARRLGLKIHIHVSETEGEVEACYKEHGCSPVAYLDRLGVLGEDVIAAHCVHLSQEDIEILARRRVVIAHCPVSNMKLASGIAPVQKMWEAGCRVTLATDGCSSNNNLDMREEMKIAALLAKVSSGPQALPAEVALQMATRAGAEAFGIDAGVIEEGRLADLLLVRMDAPTVTPSYHAVSNWVYAADSSLIDTVICNGRILMQGRRVEGEEEILREARKMAAVIRK